MDLNFDAPNNNLSTNNDLSNGLYFDRNNFRNLQLNSKLHPTHRLDDNFFFKEHYNLTHDTLNTLENNVYAINRSLPCENTIPEVSLTDNARLCLKALISPLAIFFHIGKFALTSITTTLSFAVAFTVSDLIFFSLLDKFSLAYPRYVLLGVTGVAALFSVKGVASSFVNLFLSFFKGTYSWYFSLVNPDCTFSDFLFGRNKITNKSK